MTTQALQTIEENHSVVPADVSAGALQAALAGDLSKLTGEDRLKFYGKLCEFTGLNPLSKPFDWISFQNKLTLYPNKGCAEQLRKMHGVTFDDGFERKVEFGVLITTVRGSDKTGRRDWATAALPFDEKMPAEARANAIMKCETKAKRRLTLSICGLTMFARDGEDLDDPEPARRNALPEPEDGRQALNELVNAPIDVETISGDSSATSEGQPAHVEPKPAPVTGSDQVTPDRPAAGQEEKQRTPAKQSSGANLPKAVAGSIQSAPAEPPRQPAPQPTPAVPGSLAGPDGFLTDDVVQQIEAVMAQKNPADVAQGVKDCVAYLVSKGKIKPDENGRVELRRMDLTAANYCLRKPRGLHQMVDDWIKAGRKPA